MPQMTIKTKSAEKVWTSPDGQRTIYKLVLDYNGHDVQAKTYSGVIATVGWSGDVVTEEKSGRLGMETFVKQPPKEYSGGGFTTAPTATPPSPGSPNRDNYTMFLSYVKDIAVALINAKVYSDEKLAEVATSVAATGEMFYAMRPDAPSKPEPKKSGFDGLLDDIEIIEEDTPWTEPPQLPVT